MRLMAFLQLFNELENGNLIRCLSNCRKWADEIFIYDDCSSDGSQEVYKQYTSEKNIIYGVKREFKAELFHKQQLLALVLKSNPDWIGWIDGDAILCKHLTENAKDFLAGIESCGHDGCFLHNINLWRHPAYYRVDNKYDSLGHLVFWKNNGHLYYQPVKKLHRKQYPIGMENVSGTPGGLPLLHFGFSSKRLIIKKYLTYKECGQTGWHLDRIIDELTTFGLRKTPKEWFPIGTLPDDFDIAPRPQPLSYDEIRSLSSWQEYKNRYES